MRWWMMMLLLSAAACSGAGAVASRRRCSGRLARERLKAAEKIRDKRFYLVCCAPLCATTQPRRPRPPTSTRRYQPFHKTWFGLKYGCNCSSFGSESSVCDIRTGQCRCKPHVTGRACDTCEEGYWGLQAGGCRPCSCGAGAAACDPGSGACACARGVTGAHCDTCLPGFYGFGPAGCLPCPSCEEGKVCDGATGRCTCPAGALGPHCRLCARGYWGSAPRCQRCRCGTGAISATCDAQSGACQCRTGWSGQACDSCATGHFGARCKPCGCDLAGSTANTCDEDGNCACKENVWGPKCTICREGTFGLSADSPTGCTACFCFGRSAHCTQAGLTRAAIHVPAPKHLTLVRGDALRTMEQESLLAIHTDAPDATIAVPWPPVPVYIELDKRFLGDRVTSYGGALRFRVEEEGGLELPLEVRGKFPLVRIYGRQNIVLDYYEQVPPINGTHAVRLHESLWRVRTQRGSMPASRAALMVLLQQVERIMLRVTTRAPTEEHVHALVLNVTLDTAVAGTSRSAPAHGVELCSCPAGYSAPSCQQPALGFWMPAQRARVSSVAGTIVINLEGDATPCLCSGRATQCDPDTGHCLNCTGGTGGARCEVCAEGYHGHPSTPGGCQACPCPERTRNFAAACAFNQGRLQCLCKPGYSGAECEQCAAGYKRAEDGSCAPCGCDTYGSLSHRCDELGRCQCREFATGVRCDQCAARRTFLGPEGCLPCDNCTLTLLDSMSELTSELHRRADITELSRIPKPYPALRQFAHNYTTLRAQLHHHRQHKESSTEFQREVQDAEASADRLKHRAADMRSRAAMNEEAAISLSLESMTGLEEVVSQRRRIADQVLALDEFARGERHLGAHRALKEARRLLRGVQGVRLHDHLAGASDVFDQATLQHTSIQEHNYQIDATAQRVRQLQSALAHWSRAADDVPRLADRVWDAGDEVAAVGKRARPKLVTIRDLGLRCRLLLEDVTNVSANNLTEETMLALDRARTLAHAFPELTSDLLTLTAEAEEKEGILYNLTPVYRRKYLTSVERHVNELGRKANEYKSLFAGTRALAAAGMGAARAWTDVSSTLRDAARAATAALLHAVRADKLARGARPMVLAAEQAQQASALQVTRGEEVLKRAEELRTTLEQLRRGAERVGVALRGLGWQERELAARPRADVTGTLEHAGAQADRVFSATRVLYDEAGELRRRARYHLRRQLAELQKHGDTQLGAAQEHVSQIRGNTLRAQEVAGALADAAAARAREHHVADRRLAPDAQALRDKIARARHAADSISVSVTSKPGPAGCARAYRLTSSSSSVTRISLAISFDGAVRDGPLIYLASEDATASYLKLYVEDGRLKLAWDLGDDEGRIESQERLEATHDDADHTSYRIDIERVWSTVKLVIDRAGGSTQTLSNSTAGPHVTMRPLRLWLGAPPRTSSTPVGLPGCAHALYYDDRRVGLWDFVEQPKEAQCSGCTQRWYSSGRNGEPSLVWFGGSGYSELRRSGVRPSDRRSFSLAFVFRTRDEHAALFLTRDTANNRSVSVVMRACRVVFRVEYASSALEITAPGRHCHGRAVHVQAIRVFAGNRLEKGSLRVNGEETLGSPEPPVQSPAALPDLAAASYWVGGAPPGAAADAPPLLGCLGAFTVDREGYDLLDTPTRHGVEPRCGTRTLRSATAEGSGYIEVGAPTLRRKAALGLSFRARGPSGLLLYRPPSSLIAENEVDDDDDGDNKHYLALVLTDGSLEVVAAAGKAELRMRTNGTRLDDGRLHAVRLNRVHKQLELWVDSRRVGSGTLAGNALPARSRGLYLAGLPDHLRGGGAEVKVDLRGFTGTVADLIVDGTLIGLESAVNWSGVRLGRADSEPQAEPRTEPRALQAQPASSNDCTKTSSYTVEPGAVKFGDAAWSHATLRLGARAARDLALTLQVRTFRADGLLLLVPGSKTKPRHYLALLVRDGRLRLVVRGRRRRELSLAAPLADGTWRSVSVRVSNSRLVLASGGAAATAKAPRRVGLAGRMYVGGIPDRAGLPNIPDSIVRVGGLRGCVRRVLVNGRAEDLVRDSASHHRVGQCFPRVEPGAHFAGDAHAVWSSAWSGAGGGSELAAEVRVQFRTAEPSGVLLAAAHFLLELKGGKVALTRRTSSGSEVSRVEAGGGERALCDDAWHAVVARVSPSPSLTVDGGPELRGAGPGLLDDVTDAPLTLSPLYVGGIPEGVMDNSGGGGGGGKENFKGCLREVSVGGEQRDWTHMETLHNVLLDSCPIPQ